MITQRRRTDPKTRTIDFYDSHTGGYRAEGFRLKTKIVVEPRLLSVQPQHKYTGALVFDYE